MSSTKGFSLIATVHIAPQNVDRFLEHLQVVFDTITANPECEFFQVYRSPSEPGVLSWVEDWYVADVQSGTIPDEYCLKQELTNTSACHRNAPVEWLFEHVITSTLIIPQISR